MAPSDKHIGTLIKNPMPSLEPQVTPNLNNRREDIARDNVLPTLSRMVLHGWAITAPTTAKTVSKSEASTTSHGFR